jgi:pyruvate,water dikinase
VLDELSSEPGLTPGPLHPRALRGVAGLALTVAPRAVRTFAAPALARRGFDRAVERTLAAARADLAPAGFAAIGTADRLRGTVAGVRSALRRLMPELLVQFAPVMMPAMFSLVRLRRLAAGAPDAERLVAEVLRGVPGNVTTRMDLALWRAAQTIAADAGARAAFDALDAEALTDAWAQGRLPPVGQAALASFLDSYGMRGVAEIDIGRPRWREDPADLVQTLRGYLAIEPGRAPDAVHRQSAAAGERAVEQLAAASGRHARQVRFFARRARILMGARETPKFTIVRALDEVRRAVLCCGEVLAAAGVLKQTDDVVFLDLGEIEEAAALLDACESTAAAALQQVVAVRRRAEQTEQRRRQLPRVLLGDGRTFYNRAPATGAANAQGAGVSPGVAEGLARVVLDPRRSELRPGEILVCPGTDPAWTPLFLTAAGLVTEVGGMMTHGSVVAREYGIPAVVGVDAVTTRYPTGSRIRIDGTLGTILQVDDDPSPDAHPDL